MNQDSIQSQAASIRDVIRYLKRFRNAVLVVKIDDDVLDSPLFHQHGRDLAMLAETGIRLIIVPGAKKHIDAVLAANKIPWKFENGVRITSTDALPFIKMAAFEVSNRIMNDLAAEKITGVTGNWVQARGIGIIDGVDYGSAGKIESLRLDAIRAVAADGIVPVFPCIGWSTNGKSYNISSTELACEIAIQMNADKMFFLSLSDTASLLPLIAPETSGTESSVPLENVDAVITAATAANAGHTFLTFLTSAQKVCRAGIKRVHLLNGSVEGVIPCELFSESGTGIMVYGNRFGQIRNAQKDDIPGMIALMQPLIEKGILLPRTAADIEAAIDDYVVYDIDEEIRAAAALHIYQPEQMAEIAAVCVSQLYAKQGIGHELIQCLINKASSQGIHRVFVLTTQTADWFESFGFVPTDIAVLPDARQKRWSPERNSHAYIREC